ncbi:hypothetical protein ACHAXR_011600 [Thalassiosira sp. AJA248-18]
MVITPDASVANDEEFARVLQERFRKEEEEAAAEASAARVAMSMRDVTASTDDAAAVAQPWQIFDDNELRAAAAFETSMYSGDNDADMAQRLEQEARDAEFAASLARQDQNVQQDMEQARVVSTAGNILAEDAATHHSRVRRKRTMNTILSFCIAGAIVFFVFFYLLPGRSITGGGGGGGGFDPFDPADWFGGGEWESGYEGQQGNTAWISSTTSFSGLNLRVLNNLDDVWQDTFFTVMNEWDNGDPDAVSFRIERITDSSCRMVEGAMVVCNNNYGRTSWRGINELLTNNGYVVASVAKLNDFFLEGANSDVRQYVCCHEIGHGLGLGHTDEGMYNPDLGECMDYTVRPEVNMHPGRTNFEAVALMYGNVDGSSVRGENPFDRRMDVDDSGELDTVEYYSPDDIDIKWRVLQRTAYAEHYEADLGDGRKVRRVLLLA